MVERHEGRWSSRKEARRQRLQPRSDQRVANAQNAFIDEAPAGQSKNSFGEVPGQEVVSRTVWIGESPVRMCVCVAGRHALEVLSFGKTRGRVRDSSTRGSLKVRNGQTVGGTSGGIC